MRSDHYQALSSYTYLRDIRQMIQRSEPADIMLETVKNGLDRKLFGVNDYIQHPFSKKDCWVPLIYAFCLFDQYQATVKMLFSRGANVKLEPDVDAEQLEPIVFACHSLYLGHLLKQGCNAKYTKTVLEHNMLLRLRTAEWRRLDILDHYGYIDMSALVMGYKGDLVMYCLKNMKEYLMYCYNIRQDTIDKTEETNKVIRKFVDTATCIFKWGHPPSVDAINFCIRFYMYEFLSLEMFRVITRQKKYDVVFHEDMDPIVVATFRPLLNDGRYSATCQALGLQPDPRIKQHS